MKPARNLKSAYWWWCPRDTHKWEVVRIDEAGVWRTGTHSKMLTGTAKICGTFGQQIFRVQTL